MFKKIIDFVRINIWRMDIQGLPGPQAFIVHHLRVFILAVDGFSKDDCMPRASALTYYTLLSIVPVLAMAFGIAKGFGLEEALNRQLEYYLGAHEDILEQVVAFSYSLLEETRGGVIAGIGFVFLLWSVVKVLSNIEISFNAVWGVKKPRSWIKKITEYISVMIIAPILVTMSGSMTVFISTGLSSLAEETRWLGFMGIVAELAPRVVPYVLIWLLFIFMFMAMPNTRVRLKPAIIAGVISGTMFQVMQLAYITLQVGAVKYNTVYGSFAALPLFLVWLQLSWMIVLFGAELSFAYANVKRYLFASEVKNISPEYKNRVSLLVMHYIIKCFLDQGRSAGSTEIQNDLGLPPSLVNQVLRELKEAGLIVMISESGDDRDMYQPGRDVNELTTGRVLRVLQKRGSSDIPVSGSAAWERISQAMEEFERAVESSPENVLLRDIN
jgi:membrane protein